MNGSGLAEHFGEFPHIFARRAIGIVSGRYASITKRYSTPSPLLRCGGFGSLDDLAFAMV